MDLRKAMETVIADFLEDNQGGINFIDLAGMSSKEKRILAVELADSDEFLERLTSSVEDVIAEYLNDYGDEHDIFE